MRHRPTLIRGSAMIEFVICTMPYGLFLIGVILLGELAIGKQEMYKAMAWTSAKPDDQSNDVTKKEKFFSASSGDVVYSDQPFTPTVDPAKEEPVLPYDAAGEDLRAALVRASNRVSRRFYVDDAGRLQSEITETKTPVGSYLEARGIDVLTPEMSVALGAYVDYTKSTSTYTYEIKNNTPHPWEDPVDGAAFRNPYIIDGADGAGLSHYSASPNAAGFRGYHAPDASGIDLNALNQFNADGPSGPVNTSDIETSFSGRTFKNAATETPEIWNKDYTPVP